MSDHYYWLTSFLAARGLQRPTQRVVVVVVSLLGVMPLLVMFGTGGPRSAVHLILAVCVTVGGAAIVAVWSRRRWPSRTQSVGCALAATVCISIACLIGPSPAAGLLGATSFAILIALIAFFHSVRLLTFTLGVAIATIVVLAVRAGSTDVALATSGALTVALMCGFVAFACRMAIRVIDSDVLHGEVEPLTGLLDRRGFDDRIATSLSARSREDDRYLVIAVVNLDSFSLVTSLRGVAGGEEARIVVAQALRETVRREAVLAHVSDAEFLVGDLFTDLDPTPLVERIRGAIASAPLRLTASLGVVSTPLLPLAGYPEADVLEELLTIATTAMFDARRAGGNQIRCVMAPRLTVLEPPENPSV
ncbi:diguanylate cyclase [Mycolicibacterium arabiense]|uniref:Diguanylate cyclase n=1 Tax=Mycolicibacterium arabiense TaxID=1286181 RepID=A0A7I7S2X9_9MYCO|nr:diguanylate cyclase [Mycolicibacterium arabiense]